jgi:hypothetical protein
VVKDWPGFGLETEQWQLANYIQLEKAKRIQTQQTKPLELTTGENP